MSSILIVNADDFGMTTGHNRAIVDAFRHGIVTSTSLLANGYAFEDAVSLAHQFPGLGVGVHLTLTEGPPVSPQTDKLFASEGKFPLSNQPFVRALLTGQLPTSAVQQEFTAQITRVIDSGIQPTHLDGHKYIHTLPLINNVVAQLAKQFHIPVVRTPYPLIDKPKRISRVVGMGIVSLLGAITRLVSHRAGLSAANRVAGFVDTGHLQQTNIRQLLAKPQSGVTELLCHPAYRTPELDHLLHQGYRWIAGYDFDRETAAVSDYRLRRYLDQAGWIFGNYSDLYISGHNHDDNIKPFVEPDS